MVADATAADTVPEQWPAWRAMTRIQCFPAWLEGEQLEQALLRISCAALAMVQLRPADHGCSRWPPAEKHINDLHLAALSPWDRW